MNPIKKAYKGFVAQTSSSRLARKLGRKLGNWEENINKYGEEKAGEMYEQTARAYFLANNPEKAAEYFREAADAYTQVFLSQARGKMTAEEEIKYETFRKKAIRMSALEKKIEEKIRRKSGEITLKELWKENGSINPLLSSYLMNSGLRVLTGGALISGAFFFSTKITGNVVGFSAQTSSLIGVGLLILGLIAGFFWIKNKK